jgi:hypothetical protein
MADDMEAIRTFYDGVAGKNSARSVTISELKS